MSSPPTQSTYRMRDMQVSAAGVPLEPLQFCTGCRALTAGTLCPDCFLDRHQPRVSRGAMMIAYRAAVLLVLVLLAACAVPVDQEAPAPPPAPERPAQAVVWPLQPCESAPCADGTTCAVVVRQLDLPGHAPFEQTAQVCLQPDEGQEDCIHFDGLCYPSRGTTYALTLSVTPR